jgi:hypothetical protein
MDVQEEMSGETRMEQWQKEHRKERISDRFFRRTLEREVAKQIVEISIRLRNISVRTL